MGVGSGPGGSGSKAASWTFDFLEEKDGPNDHLGKPLKTNGSQIDLTSISRRMGPHKMFFLEWVHTHENK